MAACETTRHMPIRLLVALLLGPLATPQLAAAIEVPMPAPPTAAEADTVYQLLEWVNTLNPLTREALTLRLPARFTAHRETRFRVSLRADVSRVSRWFSEVELIEAGADTICRLRFQPNNLIDKAKAAQVLGRLEPLPPPSPPPLGPHQGTISNPVFDRAYFRLRFGDGRAARLSFEPIERGGQIYEIILTAPAAH